MTAAYAAIAGADHQPELEWALSVQGGDPDEVSASAPAVPEGERAREGAGPSAAAIAELFRQALAERRSAELERGLTLVGPHRDDLVLRVRGLPVKGYASHGESWSVALGLRLASAELLRADSRLGDPVLILDDVFAELDTDRRTRLAELTVGYEQVIVTAAVEEDVPVRSAGAGRPRGGRPDHGGVGCLTSSRPTGSSPFPRRSRRICDCGASSRPRARTASGAGARRTTRTHPFTPGRDPKGVADVLADLTRNAGWDSQLAREDVVRTWAEVAGENTAQHTTPVAFTEGTLTVQADSTAWAKQLQLMRSQILSEIVQRFPEAGVDGIRFIGPDVPSWKWGPRTTPGRGPRDTYG